MHADSILINANVITVDPRKHRAEAVAVKHGRIVQVGTSEEIRETAGKDTKIIDVQRKTVVPGFIDAHNHVLSTGRTRYLLADFVVLSEDPTDVPSDSIKDIEVAMTIVGGEVVFERS